MTHRPMLRRHHSIRRLPAAHAGRRPGGLVALLIGLVLAIAIPTTSAAQSESLRVLADDAGIALGAAVDAVALADASYRQLLTEQVSLLSTRGDLSMAMVQPEPGSFDFTNAEVIVDFAVETDLKVRGHELIGGPVPGWVTNGSWTPETLGEVLRQHVTAVVGHFRERNPGVITQWDVVGNAFLPDGSPRPTIWQQVIGDDYLRIAFEAARAADPDAELFYDDFYDDLAVTQDAVASGVPIVAGANAERTTCDAVTKCVAVRDRIAALLASGAPIDGIGLQSHLFSPDPADFAQFTDWVGELGLRWAITEFDVPLPVTEIDNPASLEYQATVYAAALAACADAPECDTFVTWGISDRFSPIPAQTGGAFGGALWFDENDVAKPAFGAMADVLGQRAGLTTTITEAPTSPTDAGGGDPLTTAAPTVSSSGDDSDDTSAAFPALIGLGAIAVVAAVVVLVRRRRPAQGNDPPNAR
jgi:endo-1,4-beta-xylanase